MKKLIFFTYGLFLFSSLCVQAQIDTVILSESASQLFPSFPNKSSFTSIIDQSGLSNIYSANMESGLGVYNTSIPNQINTVTDLPISYFNNLDVSCLKQRNHSLFVGIGDFQVNTNSSSGLAILEISNPANPVLKDIWDSTGFTHGISHILIDNNYAYLSTMSDGIIILDISDESNIRFVSSLQLDLNFPAPSSNAHNARGLKIKNDTLLVCFDRGGLRTVVVTDKVHPIEIYKYINNSLNSTAAAAYNDVFIKDHYAFISVDYCGLEIIDISSFPYTNIQWYNPWGCNTVNWSGAALHTNELKSGNNDSLLFISAGQSELLVFDITDPSVTVLKGEFGDIGDSLAVYGLDVFEGKISLSYIHTPIHIPPFTPFYSYAGGLKLLDYNLLPSTGIKNLTFLSENIKVFPNPTTDKIHIEAAQEIMEIKLKDVSGRMIVRENYPTGKRSAEFDISSLAKGLYFITLKMNLGVLTKKLIIQ